MRNVLMDRTSMLAMNSPTPLPLVLSLLPVLWMGQNVVMEHVTMSYRTTLQTADVGLQCLSSVVKVWLCLWLPQIQWGEATLLCQETLVSLFEYSSSLINIHSWPFCINKTIMTLECKSSIGPSIYVSVRQEYLLLQYTSLNKIEQYHEEC